MISIKLNYDVLTFSNSRGSFMIDKNLIHDGRSWILKFFHKVSSIVLEFFSIIALFYNRIKALIIKKKEYVVPNSTNLQWSKTNKGLCVLVHGLRAAPSDWNGHIKELKKEVLDIEIIAPYIHKKGNCSLEDAARPILEIVKDYIKHHPKNPICLIGASNGGRIIDYIDINLRNQNVDIKISTIAGAHYGSKVATFVSKIPLIHRILDKNLKVELAYGSSQVTDTIKAMREKITQGNRSYDFYATTEEYMVTPFHSCFPRINQDEQYYLVHGHGHSSIVKKVRKHQINKCVEWLKAKNVELN